MEDVAEERRKLRLKMNLTNLMEFKKEVGDEVKWHVLKWCYKYGSLLDGAYSSYSNKGPDDIVIIKDHKVEAVEPIIKDFEAYPIDLQVERMKSKWNIHDLPSTLWTWESRFNSLRNKIYTWVHLKWMGVRYIRKTPIERVSMAISKMTRRMLREQSFLMIMFGMDNPPTNIKIRKWIYRNITKPIWIIIDGEGEDYEYIRAKNGKMGSP